jgi:hypothetical protein
MNHYHVNSGIKIDHKHTYTLHVKTLCKSRTTNMVTMQIFEVISDRFNEYGIITSKYLPNLELMQKEERYFSVLL